MSGELPKVELSHEELEELHEMFDLLDKNKGGTISADEVHWLMRLLGTQSTYNDTMAILKESNKDGSGELNFDEFVQITAGTQRTSYSGKDASRAFKMFAEADAPEGKISKDSLHKVMMQYRSDEVTDEDAWRLINQMDVDIEGWVDYQKKVSMFLK